MRNGTCALCGHTKVIELRPKSRGYRSAYNPVVVANIDAGFFSAEKEVGQLLVYACLKCGFAQTFVEDVESVPIGPKYETRLVRTKRSSEPPQK